VKKEEGEGENNEEGKWGKGENEEKKCTVSPEMS